MIKKTPSLDNDSYRSALAERLKQVFQRPGIKKSKIAEICGVSPQAVSGWLNTGRIDKKNLSIIADHTGCDIDWLLSGFEYDKTDKRKPEQEAEFIGDIEPWDSKTPLHEDEVELPFFREVELAAGNGMTEVIENHGPKLRFSKATLRRVGAQVGHAACVNVIGNSMEPMLPSGCTVGIDTLKTQIVDGKIYAIDHSGMLRVKILYRLPGGGIRIKSFNTEEYPDESLTAEEAKSVKVLGKVFWYSGLLH